mmetsp:Transcript_92751/g.258350  ORF Transcript_92751/g.258350 Transcript_92751/m.258350 type:complete len:365 (-) Transcript_92751:8-1102(-)
MDSTRAIIRLWRLCVPVGMGPLVGGDGALAVEVLKQVLERELSGNLSALGCSTVDDILWTYMQPDTAGVVGFLQFWRGMEDILQACGAHRSSLSSSQLHAMNGFRFLRKRVLETASKDVSQGRTVFSVRELRYLIADTMREAGPEGESFWRRRAAQLPDDTVYVTGEELASALLEWLQQLVDSGSHDEAVPPMSISQSLSDEPDCTSTSSDEDLDESTDEDGRVPAHIAGLPGQMDCASSTPTSVPVLMIARATAAAAAGAAPGGAAGTTPATPKGPPPRRSVLGGSVAGRTSTEGHGAGALPGTGRCNSQTILESADDDGKRASCRKGTLLETGLLALLERTEKRPVSMTKEAAAEWRGSVKF